MGLGATTKAPGVLSGPQHTTNKAQRYKKKKAKEGGKKKAMKQNSIAKRNNCKQQQKSKQPKSKQQEPNNMQARKKKTKKAKAVAGNPNSPAVMTTTKMTTTKGVQKKHPKKPQALPPKKKKKKPANNSNMHEKPPSKKRKRPISNKKNSSKNQLQSMDFPNTAAHLPCGNPALDEQLSSMAAQCRPTRPEIALRQAWVNAIRVWTDREWTVFGSAAKMALCTADSDLDLVCTGMNFSPTVPSRPQLVNNEAASADVPIEPSRKRQRVEEWKRVLAAADEDNAAAPSPVDDSGEDVRQVTPDLDEEQQRHDSTSIVSSEQQQQDTPTPPNVESTQVSHHPTRDAPSPSVQPNPKDEIPPATVPGLDDDRDGTYDDDDSKLLEVSHVSIVPAAMSLPPLSKRMKQQVNQTLGKLYRRLQQQQLPLVHMEWIRHARVPILKLETTALKLDLGCDGHAGMNTRYFCDWLMQTYPSAHWHSVIVLLKVMMQAAHLDEPFTGGLGSFKLYVLMAHCLEHHLDHCQGQDTPSAILLAFLQMYTAHTDFFEGVVSFERDHWSLELDFTTLRKRYSIVKRWKQCCRVLQSALKPQPPALQEKATEEAVNRLIQKRWLVAHRKRGIQKAETSLLKLRAHVLQTHRDKSRGDPTPRRDRIV